MLDISLEDNIFINTQVENFLQEIDILFNAKLTSTFGEVFYGTDFEQFIWQSGDKSEEIIEYIKQQIARQCSLANYFVWEVECQLVLDEQGDEFYYVLFGIIDTFGEIIKRGFVIHNFGDWGPDGTTYIAPEADALTRLKNNPKG